LPIRFFWSVCTSSEYRSFICGW